LASAQQDLLHVLAREHRDHSIAFHDLIDHLETTAPRHRRRQYSALVTNLAVHLAAETTLVHPLVMTASAHGEETRRTREREIRSLEVRLTEAGGHLDDLDDLREALLVASGETASHADREELEMFAYARHAATPQELRRFGRSHATLRQRLPTRYQREGNCPHAPWADPRLHASIRSWYAESLPDLPVDDDADDRSARPDPLHPGPVDVVPQRTREPDVQR
jgi:hypothetical protein